MPQTLKGLAGISGQVINSGSSLAKCIAGQGKCPQAVCMSNPKTAVLEPNEFHSQEVQQGPPLRVYVGFRLSLPMDGHLEIHALSNRCDKSVIVRQALHEYFERRGIDAWLPA